MPQDNTVHQFPPQPPKAPTTTPVISMQSNAQVTPPHQPKQPQTPTAQPSNASQTTPTQQTGTPPTQHTVPHKMEVSDADCYDSCTNLGGPEYRKIQATP